MKKKYLFILLLSLLFVAVVSVLIISKVKTESHIQSGNKMMELKKHAEANSCYIDAKRTDILGLKTREIGLKIKESREKILKDQESL